MARKKSLDSKVKSAVQGFVAELLPLLRQKVAEDLAAARAKDSDEVEYHFEDGGTLGYGSVPPVSEDALDQGELVEFEIETIPDTEREPVVDSEYSEIPQTIYPT